MAAVGEIGLAIENARALARGAVRAMALDDSTPPEVVAAIRELAIAARELGAALEDGDEGRSREAALRAVRLANAVLDETAQPVGGPHRRAGPPRGGGPAEGERHAAAGGPGRPCGPP